MIGHSITQGIGYRTSIWVVVPRFAVRARVVTVRLAGIKVWKWRNSVWVVSCANGRGPNRLGIISSPWARSACQIKVGFIFGPEASAPSGICRQSVDVTAVTVKLRPLDSFVCKHPGHLDTKSHEPTSGVLTIIEVREPLSRELPDEKGNYRNKGHATSYRQTDNGTAANTRVRTGIWWC